MQTCCCVRVQQDEEGMPGSLREVLSHRYGGMGDNGANSDEFHDADIPNTFSTVLAVHHLSLISTCCRSEP